MMNRREALALAVATGVASALLPLAAQSQETHSSQCRITDTNVSLFRWPFRRLPLDETDALVRKLRSLGISEAWAGSFEGILHRDIASVNQRLADACRVHRELIPIGSIDLELPGWEDDLNRCIDAQKMPGIRLHPNYHGYTLDDPRHQNSPSLPLDFPTRNLFVLTPVANGNAVFERCRIPQIF